MAVLCTIYKVCACCFIRVVFTVRLGAMPSFFFLLAAAKYDKLCDGKELCAVPAKRLEEMQAGEVRSLFGCTAYTKVRALFLLCM